MSDEEAARVVANIGRKVAEIRQDQGLTQADFAEKLGATVQWVGYIEQGKQNITIHTLVKLAQALGVLPAALLEEPRSREVRAGRPRKRI